MAAPGGHYSHATVADGWVFVSGQLPITPDGRKLVDAPFEEQARQVLANVQAALQGCGARTQDLVQVRVYVTDIADWPAFNAIYAQWTPDHRPARAVVPVPVLHHGLKIEVEVVARFRANGAAGH
ncbi:MAG: RidA family protein [Casimicrobiaceae bacterium]